jgi:dephospho-CoA kinase
MGSGKTSCSKVFELLGVPVYNADLRGKYILEENTGARSKLIDLFGNDIYVSTGILDRKKLAGIVFNDQAKLKLLEEIVHPAVQEDFEEFRTLHQSSPYILKEAALLYETGTYKALDKIILVVSPLEIRLKRIKERDDISEKDILARISKQWADEKKLELAGFVIRNDEKEMILPQILKLHKEFINWT